MLVGSDKVVREVHAAMVAWDGSAGGLSRLPASGDPTDVLNH